jgi:hypothetical protein
MRDCTAPAMGAQTTKGSLAELGVRQPAGVIPMSGQRTPAKKGR